MFFNADNCFVDLISNESASLSRDATFF
jgi:hypothetical protein